jgi:hypothetical protein
MCPDVLIAGGELGRVGLRQGRAAGLRACAGNAGEALGGCGGELAF